MPIKINDSAGNPCPARGKWRTAPAAGAAWYFNRIQGGTMPRRTIAITAALLVLLAATAFASIRTDASGNVIWNKRHIDLTLKVSDDVSGVQSVELWYRKKGGEWLKWPQQPRPCGSEGRFIAAFDAPDDGLYEFHSVSIDKVGNSSGAPTEYTQPRVTVNFDTRAPELDVAFQTDCKTLAPASSVKFNWLAKDENLKSIWVRYYWDEAADKPSLQTLVGDSGTYSIPVPAEGASRLTMQVVVEDYAGFKTTTQTFSWEIKEPAPAQKTDDKTSEEPQPKSGDVAEQQKNTQTGSATPKEAQTNPSPQKDTQTGSAIPKEAQTDSSPQKDAPATVVQQEETPPTAAQQKDTPTDVVTRKDAPAGSADTVPEMKDTKNTGEEPPVRRDWPEDVSKQGSSAQTEPVKNDGEKSSRIDSAPETKHETGNTAPKQDDFKPNPLQVGIKYDVVQSGPSGLDRVELWYTRVDATDWKKKWSLYKFSNTGAGTFVFDAPEIGEYGFYIIAQNRAGYWSKPRPDGQAEIEPDYTRWIDPYAPFLKIVSPKGGEILRGGSEVNVRWVANDDNLLEKPVKIELYSGTDRALVVENATENDGEHSFIFPYKKGRYWIKVTVTDRAGHVTEQNTPEFLIDSGPPTIAIQVMEEEYMQEDIGISESNDTVAPSAAPDTSYAAENETITDDGARDAFARGAALLARGRAEDALEHLRKAASHFSSDDKIVNEYGIALYQLKQYDAALAQFRSASALAPANSGYIWNIFLANYGLADADASAKAAVEMLKTDPNRAEIRGMIDAVVDLYLRGGRDSEANAFLKTVLDSAKLSDSLKTYIQTRMR